MGKIEAMLVVIDPTVERDFVVDRALIVANASGARVNLFINNSNTLDEHSFQYEGIDGSFFEKQNKLFREHYEHILEQLEQEFKAAGLDAKIEF
ncbi:MAG: hypothetical protein RLN96_05710, partial [Pseudomonadales bacterium]